MSRLKRMLSMLLLLGIVLATPRTAIEANPAPRPIPPPRTNINAALGNPTDAKNDSSQKDNFLLEKPQYVLSYNDGKGGPNWVSWHLQASDIGTAGRQNNFHPETALPQGFKRVLPTDYTGSGYDRGHMCNSKDRTSSAANNTQTFSMANMLPQTAALNRHVWEKLEAYTRTLTKSMEMYIIAGGYGSKETIGKANKVNVPTNCWKIVVVTPAGGRGGIGRITADTRVIAVDMPNTDDIQNDPWQKYIKTVADIETATGYSFFTSLPQDVQTALKAKRDSGRASATRRARTPRTN